ncbi:MAG TPA: hypothetical protein VNW46_11885 [Gemmatimonadaceae bacterium]|nr:hypothetical protein [Gemmatimonadaceae bacterium]
MRQLEEGREPTGPIAAAVLAVLGFLPLVDWIGGVPYGIHYDDFPNQLAGWVSGSAVVVGIAVVLAILARRIPALWPAHAARATGEWVGADRTRIAIAAAVLAGITYAAIAQLIFNGRPMLIDEIAQLRQAEIFAQGRLWLPAPTHPEFFSSLQMVTSGGRVFSQYPPGGPAMLAPLTALGIPWLTGPIAGALAVLAFAWVLRVAEPDSRTAAAALVLFAFAPFVMFLSGTYMNCVTALAWILLGAAALAHGMASAMPRPTLAALAGCAFGVAATIRPVDALAFALPAAVWYVARAWRDPRRWRDALAAAGGVAVPIALMLLVNARTTGAPLLFGYDLLWGHGHELGFHRAPTGEVHTPARGLELINTYLLQLQRYLYEAPIPALLPATVALALSRRWQPVDRYLAASAALVLGLYLAYWHDGFYLGPRFVFALAPVIALWTARCLPLAWSRGQFLGRVAVYTLATSALLATIDIGARAYQYAHTMTVERWATPDVARRAGVPRGALVLVVESWEAQLVVRMWALGVRAADGESIYRSVDACRLDAALRDLEASGDPGPSATAALRALTGDSARVESVKLAPGANVRVERGYAYSRRCLARVAESRAGVVPLAPLLVLDDGNVYARDLHEGDTLLLAAYPNRPIYALRAASAAADAVPVFVPVSRDSLYRAWNAER